MRSIANEMLAKNRSYDTFEENQHWLEIIKIKFTVDKGSLRGGRGVCTEIHEAELWRFMELPVAARANRGPAWLVIRRVQSVPGLKPVSKRARIARKKSR